MARTVGIFTNAVDEPRILSESIEVVRLGGTDRNRNQEFFLPRSILKHFVPTLHVWHKCGRCQLDYQEMYNFNGECRYHPKGRDGRSIFKCCGKSDNSIGCVRCDHSPDFEWSVDMDSRSSFLIAIPTSVLPMLSRLTQTDKMRKVCTIGSFEQEEKEIVPFPVTVILPYEGEWRALPLKPESVKHWAQFNNTLRWEMTQDNYYDEFSRKFNEYILVSRCWR